jgi:Outer membrane protein beta-barrel domain
MKIVKVIVLYFLFFISTVFAQKKTFVGFEFGVNKDFYVTSQKLSTVRNLPSISSKFGFIVEQQITNRFFLELGISYKKYKHLFEYKVSGGGLAFWTELPISIFTLQMPLRLKYAFQLRNEKWSLKPYIGYCYLLNKELNNGYNRKGSFSVIENGSDTNKVIYNYYNSYYKSVSLLEVGLNVDFRLNKHAVFFGSVSNYFGFVKLDKLNIKFYNNSDLINATTVQTSGSYFNLSFGFKYEMAHLIPKKRKEINSIDKLDR